MVEPAVVFITPTLTGAPIRIEAGAAHHVDLASARLRGFIPAAEIARHAPVWMVGLAHFLADPALTRPGRPLALVLGKISTGALLADATLGGRVIAALTTAAGTMRCFADLCDDYAAAGRETATPALAAFQAALCRVAQIIVPCQAMAEALAGTGAEPIVIEDPYEGAEAAAPRFAPGRSLRLCWFGSLTPPTQPAVAGALEAIMRRIIDRPLEFLFVAAPDSLPWLQALGARIDSMRGDVRLRFAEWSIAQTRATLAESDAAILPQDPASGWGRTKSHNRFVETLRAGRLALAAPIPSYVELERFGWVGADPGEGLAWALAHPGAVIARVTKGQEHVAKRFAPDVIGAKWMAALGVSPGSSAPAPAKMRLNLGCGDKILPGYINVDVAAVRGGQKPDVLCDLRRLGPFADGCADEVLAVHVIEHFWRWEVVEILRDWARVLRPGGRMIVECPNLLTACAEILKDPAGAVGPGPEGQRTMWVLYGDPAWRDPLMCHCWNYTPDSLIQVMREAGLVALRQEPAQFKLREPRDMRITGIRPDGASHTPGDGL
jgi:SAM-dependent methyltransferase